MGLDTEGADGIKPIRLNQGRKEVVSICMGWIIVYMYGFALGLRELSCYLYM